MSRRPFVNIELSRLILLMSFLKLYYGLFKKKPNHIIQINQIGQCKKRR